MIFDEFLDAVDSFLLDVAQLACGSAWLEFGWSRRILACVAAVVSIAGLTPLVAFLFRHGTGAILVLPAIMSAWVITKINSIYLLLADEWRTRRFVGVYPLESNFQGFGDSNERKITLILSVATLPIALVSMTLPSMPIFIPSCYLVGGIGNLFSVYLKPPG